MWSDEMLNFDYKLSQVTINFADKRDMFADYYNLDDKKAEYHTIVVASKKDECTDGGIYFRVFKYENYHFVAELWDVIEEAPEKALINEYFKTHSKVIKGEKELRSFIADIYKIYK